MLQRQEVRELFERQGVLSAVELESRFGVYAEQYVLAIEMEAKLALHAAPNGTQAHMRHCADSLMPLTGDLRAAVDGLEGVVDDGLWPLPSYQEMLFMR